MLHFHEHHNPYGWPSIANHSNYLSEESFTFTTTSPILQSLNTNDIALYIESLNSFRRLQILQDDKADKTELDKDLIDKGHDTMAKAIKDWVDKYPIMTSTSAHMRVMPRSLSHEGQEASPSYAQSKTRRRRRKRKKRPEMSMFGSFSSMLPDTGLGTFFHFTRSLANRQADMSLDLGQVVVCPDLLILGFSMLAVSLFGALFAAATMAAGMMTRNLNGLAILSSLLFGMFLCTLTLFVTNSSVHKLFSYLFSTNFIH